MLDPDHPIAELLQRDKRYHFDAYLFVFEALRFAQENLGMGTEHVSEDSGSGESSSDGSLSEDPILDDLLSSDSVSKDLGDDADDEQLPERHVTGQELCEAMRLYAHDQYGYLAKSVLNHWGILSTGDFGEIVFNLIEIEQMRKTPNDCREDFNNVFDFDEGFRHSFQFSLPDSSEERRR